MDFKRKMKIDKKNQQKKFNLTFTAQRKVEIN